VEGDLKQGVSRQTGTGFTPIGAMRIGNHEAPHGRTSQRLVTRRDYNTAMSDSAEGVARAFVRAINRQDVAGLAALMSPEHRVVDSLGSVIEGREAVLAGWAGYFRMVPDYSIAVEETLCDGSAVVMLGVAQGTYSPDGRLRAESRWETPAAFRAFVEDGLVAEWRVYADNEPLRQKMRKA